MSERYRLSEEMHHRAMATIPLGTQTFSKSRTQYPFGVSPYFIVRGQGSHVWDADGNEYIDFVNGLASVTIGYNDPDVNAAVRQQLECGVIFSLPHPLEIEVAEELVKLVPCAERVRFGKNGSDATAGAIRVARAFTGRERVAVCGYHGWQDWYIGSTARHRGVPRCTRELTHTFPYNDPDALESLLASRSGEFAAVILEPMNTTAPKYGYLEAVRDITHRHGALLVFDEMITGFRYEIGGAQERFGVTPDLATFGKGLANGYPLAAVVGRADVMQLMEEIFFSFTFGGELLSLAAAKAALTKLQREPVIATLKRQGTRIMEGITQRIKRWGLEDVLSIAGDPTWSFFIIQGTPKYSQWQIKTLFLQEMFQRGILTLGTHNVSYAHNDDDVIRLLDVYDEVFPLISHALEAESLEGMLRAEALEPLFKVR